MSEDVLPESQVNVVEKIASFTEHTINMNRERGIIITMSNKTALKFLRARKFDVSKAVALYMEHQAAREIEGLNNMSISDDDLKSELESEKFTVFKTRSPKKAQLSLFKAKLHRVDKSKKDSELTSQTHRNTLRGIIYQLDTALEDEETQQNGLFFIYDMRGAEYRDFDFDSCNKILRFLKGSYPAKMKRILIVGPPAWFRCFYHLLTLIVRQKLRERITLTSINQLNKFLPLESLPPELGGTYLHDHQAWLKECISYQSRANGLEVQLDNSTTDTSSSNEATITNKPIEPSINSSHQDTSKQQQLSHAAAANSSTSESATSSQSLIEPLAIMSSGLITADIVETHNQEPAIETVTISKNSNSYSNPRPTIDLSDIKPPSSPPRVASFKSDQDSLPKIFDYEPDKGMTLDEFAQCVRDGGAKWISSLYDVDGPDVGTFKNCLKEENVAKNRYVNVKCYDHTRVILEPYDLEGFDGSTNLTSRQSLIQKKLAQSSNFINANWIDGFNQPKAYISTQGPTPATLTDFWRMVWQTGSRVIAMVTLTVENNTMKCDKYWPSPISDINNPVIPISSEKMRQIRAGIYTIDYIGTEQTSDYMITHLRLTNHRSKVSRDIWHMQFISWPDFGTPATATALLKFRHSVMAKQKEAIKLYSGASQNLTGSPKSPDKTTYPPIIVHCSAGVGRSGTFITIDICINKLKATGLIDIRDVVHNVRLQRYSSIQTREQFIFCFKSVYEYARSKGLVEGEIIEPKRFDT